MSIKGCTVIGLGLLLFVGCSPIVVKSEIRYIKDSYEFTDIKLAEREEIATVNVDYDTVNRSVFFSFSTGKQYEIPYDAWDLAVCSQPDSRGTCYVIGNSGDYGENVRILPLKQGSIKEDYMNGINGFTLHSVRQASFLSAAKNSAEKLSPYQNDPDTGQPVANPLYAALTDGRSYFLKVGKNDLTAGLFIIRFAARPLPHSVGMTFVLHVIPCVVSGGKNIIGFREEYAVHGTVSDEYSFHYIKLGPESGTFLGKEKNNGGVPLKNDWDVMLTRVHVYSAEMGKALKTDGIVGSSAILTNTPAGVQAAALYGWDFPEVERLPTVSAFHSGIDAIGKGYGNPLSNDTEKRRKAWYYGIGMPPTFYLSRITYVILCAGGGYAKFRPGSFYGPNGERFYVSFRYNYIRP